MYRKIAFVIFLSLFNISIYSQDSTDVVINIIEQFIDHDTKCCDIENLYSILEGYRIDPLNLNVATRQELSEFPFLSEQQIEEFLYYRYSNGELLTINALKLVPLFGKKDIDMLSPFVCVRHIVKEKKFPSFKELISNAKHELLSRTSIPLYNREGFRNKYLGNKIYNNIKYKFSSSNTLEYGLSLEKDPGEPFFTGINKQGYDYYSFYCLLKNYRRIKRLAIGDYKISFGEGLVVNKNFAMSPSYSLTTYRPSGIRRHSSVDEQNYFSGLAASLQLSDKWYFSPFYSRRFLDGRVSRDTIYSFSRSGLHRTDGEISRKNTILEQTYGCNITYDYRKLTLGFTGIHTFFDKTYSPNTKGYRKYYPQGKRFTNMGVSYRFVHGSKIFRGELAKGNKGFAISNTMNYAIPYLLDLLFSHRYYSKDYNSLHGSSQGVSSSANNEHSLYLACKYSPRWNLSIFTSLEYFHFPYMKYRISRSSQGFQTKNQILYTPRKDLTLQLRYLYRKRDRDIWLNKTKKTYATHHHKLSSRIQYNLGRILLLSIFDYNIFSSVDKGSRGGLGITQRLSYKPDNETLKLSTQLGYYSTPDYDTRIYVYEPSLYGSFYIPSYFNKRLRMSNKFDIILSDHLLFQLKYSLTYLLDKDSFSSGINKINKKTKQDIEFLLRLKY